ncbi:MAG: phosphoribosylformylglycinamidine synthase I [Candidatus Omnitrophica bacterium]|nr:phosphoribosylformylglycinamidine synthase I [Candidatus Omnitrophota bacterium]
MLKPKVCVLRSAGTNCDQETAAAFKLAGGVPELLHINNLVNANKTLNDFQILALPGGFSYGDDVASGKIFANELRFKLAEELRKFIADGKLIIGICNGFQILVKSGLLPGHSGLEQDTSLILNDSAKFEARWVYLKPGGRCVWTKGLKKIIYLPVAHGEGKFVVQDKRVLSRLKKNNQIVFQYCDAQGKPGGYPDNPNGSLENIAGITDPTGRILGLMPHPERHLFSVQHPRKDELKFLRHGDGLQIFKNGIDYIKKNF